MQATKAQVSAVMRKAVKAAGPLIDSWAEKSFAKGVETSNVVYAFKGRDNADAVCAIAQAEFVKLCYTNELTVTGEGDYGRCYVNLTKKTIFK